jgi:hypothetical protein
MAVVTADTVKDMDMDMDMDMDTMQEKTINRKKYPHGKNSFPAIGKRRKDEFSERSAERS